MIIRNCEIKEVSTKRTVDGSKVTKIIIFTDTQCAAELDTFEPQTLVNITIDTV